MYQGKSSALFVKFAIPQMIGLLFNSVYLIVDGMFIGNRLGREAMAAAAVAVPFIEILIALAMAVASGAGIIISTKLGRKETVAAKQTFNLAVMLLLIASVLIVTFGNVCIDQLAWALGATPDIHADAVTYLWYIVTFSPFLLFSFLLGGLARNDGRPKLAMFALAFGSVSNIALDYIFMYPLNMGIAGAALATALGPLFSVLILLPHFLMKKGHLHFAKPVLKWRPTMDVFRLGFPSFIMEFTIGMITLVYNSAIIRNGYGEIGLAAYLIIGYLMLIILTIFLGLAEGLQPVFSYLTGTGEHHRNRALLSFSVKVFLSIGIASYVLIILFSRNFISIFTPGDPELIQFTQDKCLYYFSGFFLAGYNILMISYWQSIQNARRALPLSLLRSVILPPVLIFMLPHLFGMEALWLCHSLSEILTALAAFLIGMRQMK